MIHDCSISQCDLELGSTRFGVDDVFDRIHQRNIGTGGLLILPLSTSSSRRPLGNQFSLLIVVRAFPRSVPIKIFLKKDFEGGLAEIRYFFSPVLIVRLKRTFPFLSDIVTVFEDSFC